MKKTPQTNIAVNDPYDTRLLDPHTLVLYRSFTTMLIWIVSLQFYQNVCLLLSLFMHISFIFYKVVERRIRSLIGKDMDKIKVPRLLWLTLYMSKTSRKWWISCVVAAVATSSLQISHQSCN